MAGWPDRVKFFQSQEHDQTSFQGRLKQTLNVCDPRYLLPSTFFGMSFEQAETIVKNYRDISKPVEPSLNPSTVWLARRVVQSAINVDDGNVIPPPFRMCGFAVFGSPIMVGLLLPNPSLVGLIFWQSLNQTHNAFVNYFNRNATQPVTVRSIAEGYAGAVASSVSIAVGLNQWLKHAKFSPATKTMLSRFVPFPAVAVASSCNMLMMRKSELTTGINVVDEDGVDHGASQAAAKQALFETMLTRVVLPAPLLLAPPIVMHGISLTKVFNKFPRLRLPAEAVVCFFSFVFGLPFAISLFPQQGSIEASALEPQFQNLKDSKGKPITKFLYNKGL